MNSQILKNEIGYYKDTLIPQNKETQLLQNERQDVHHNSPENETEFVLLQSLSIKYNKDLWIIVQKKHLGVHIDYKRYKVGN